MTMAWNTLDGSAAGSGAGLCRCAIAGRRWCNLGYPAPGLGSQRENRAGAATIYTPKEKKEYQKKTAAELATIQEKIIDYKDEGGNGAPAKQAHDPQECELTFRHRYWTPRTS